MNPLTGLYFFPRERDFSSFQNNYAILDAATNVMTQNWFVEDHHQSNPYWILNKQPREDRVRRAISSLKLDYQITDKISFQARASYDFTDRKSEQRDSAGSNTTNVGSNGRYVYSRFVDDLFYTDGILSFNDQISEDISLTAIVGASLQRTNFGEGISANNGTDGLFYANEFNFQNYQTNIQVQSTLSSKIEKQALFGNFVLGYKDFIFLAGVPP